MGRVDIGYAEDERGIAWRAWQSAASGVDGGTGCVADGKIIAQIPVAIAESVQWDVVQLLVGHDHQVAGVELLPDGCNEGGVQIGEMAAGGGETGIGDG